MGFTFGCMFLRFRLVRIRRFLRTFAFVTGHPWTVYVVLIAFSDQVSEQTYLKPPVSPSVKPGQYPHRKTSPLNFPGEENLSPTRPSETVLMRRVKYHRIVAVF